MNTIAKAKQHKRVFLPLKSFCVCVVVVGGWVLCVVDFKVQAFLLLPDLVTWRLR